MLLTILGAAAARALPPPATPAACGALWTGTMKGEHAAGRDRITTDVRVRLCETRQYPLKKGHFIKGAVDNITLMDAGSTLTIKYWTDGSDEFGCTQTGQGTSAAMNPTGEILRTLEDVGRNAELKWSEPTYKLSIAAADSLTVTQVCTYATGTQRLTFEGGQGGHGLNSGPERELPFNAGRMIGSYQDGPQTVSWSICRENTPCPPPPSPGGGGGPAPDRCAEGPALALARHCREQLARQIDGLVPKLTEYTRLQKRADQFWPDFKWAAAQCAAFSAAQMALEAALGGMADDLGKAGANAERARQVLQAMIEGDYGGLVLDVDSFEEVDEFKYGLENTKKVLDVLDKAGAVANVLSQSRLELGESLVDACLGAVDPELHRKAELFIEYSKEAATYYGGEVAPAKNDIRSRALECLEKDFQAWRACRQSAECRGETPEGCGPDPHEIFNQP